MAPGEREGKHTDVALARAALTRAIHRHGEARWWIDHRDALRRVLDADYQQEIAQYLGG